MPVYSRRGVAHRADGTEMDLPAGLVAKGPRLRCEVSVDDVFAAQKLAAGHRVIPAVSGWIMIDTGASASAVDLRTLAALEIRPIGAVQVSTPTSQEARLLFPCGLSLPGSDLPSWSAIHVIGADLAALGLIALLGRDLLETGVLVYNGPLGVWTLAF